LWRQIAVASGKATPVDFRMNGITEQMYYYLWRRECSGLQGSAEE
jgi:hypothetical protein